MDIRAIRCFIALAETLHFTKAAERLYLSQPTLSRQISELEKEIGYPLVIRTTRNVVLTEVGELCLRRMKNILAELERMGEEVQRCACGKKRVQIGFATMGHVPFVSSCIQTMAQRDGAVEIGLLRCDPPELKERLLSGKIDCALLHMPSVRDVSGIQWKILKEVGMAAKIPLTNPLSGRKSLRLRDLAKEDIVMYERSIAPLCYDFVLQKLAGENGNIPNVQVHSSQQDAVSVHVAGNRGIAVVSELVPEWAGTQSVPIEDFRQGFELVFAVKVGQWNETMEEIYQTMKKVSID